MVKSLIPPWFRSQYQSVVITKTAEPEDGCAYYRRSIDEQQKTRTVSNAGFQDGSYGFY